MFKQLLLNSTILIAALFVIGQRFVYKPLNHQISVKYKMLVGVLSGIVGSILITNGLPVTSRILVDFRYIALIVAAIYAGPVAAITGAVILHFPSSNFWSRN